MGRRTFQSTKRSGNTSSFDRNYYNIYTPIRIVDNSGDGLPKKVFIFMANVAEVDNNTYLWKEFHISTSSQNNGFTFFGNNVIRASTTSKVLHGIDAVIGKKYHVNDSGAGNKLELLGNASISTEFSVVNNTEDEMTVHVERNGDILAAATADASGTVNFQFRPTFYIYATSNLSEEAEFENANTEISLLGVTSADIRINGSGPYSFSLVNIT